jgi:tetratricopeptide (TPR) repeat protein
LDALASYLSERRDLKTSWQKVDEIKKHLTERVPHNLRWLRGDARAEGERYGFMMHLEFAALLKFIADAEFRGLCLITTRTNLTELKTYSQYKECEVERLSTEDGIELLNKIGVRGTEEEKKNLVERQNGYALGLTLVANYLMKDFSGDIKEAEKIPKIYGKIEKLLRWYADEIEREMYGRGLCSQRGVNYANFLISENRIDEASDLTYQNLEWNKNRYPADISRCHRVLSAIYRKRKEYKEAEEHINTSLEIAEKVGMPYLEIEALIEVGKLYLEKKDPKSAIETANKIIELCKRTGLANEPDAELILAKAYSKDKEKSKHYAQSAHKKAKDMGYKIAEKEVLKVKKAT